MMMIYGGMYGLSHVGKLEEVVALLARALELSFSGYYGDSVGRHYDAHNEDWTERLCLLDDSGEQPYLEEEYGCYDFFLEMTTCSFKRAREIEMRIHKALEPLQQEFLNKHQAFLQREKAREERLRAKWSRGESTAGDRSLFSEYPPPRKPEMVLLKTYDQL